MTDVQTLGAFILVIDFFMMIGWFFISRHDSDRVINEVQPKYTIIYTKPDYTPKDIAHVQEDYQVRGL